MRIARHHYRPSQTLTFRAGNIQSNETDEVYVLIMQHRIGQDMRK